jgi:hypothetical protein
MEITWMITTPEGTVIPRVQAGNGWLMPNDDDGALSASVIPGPYPMGQIPYNTGKPPVSSEQEKNATPSIDPYITERDRWTVASLPPEGRKEFGDNVHRYIRQLGKDYLDEADDAAE